MARLGIVLFVLALSFGCAATKGGRGVQEKGFLSDYSMLEENPGEGAQLRYLRKDADWKRYDKMLLDPVQFWRGADVEAGLTPEQSQGLANYFHSAVYERLSKDYQMVSIPGAGTLRISVAFTRLGDRNVTLDTVSTYVPQMRLMSELKGKATGKPAFVGQASMEAKVTDGASGQVLGAAVDHRVGGKTIKSMDDWADVKAAIDHWAELLSSSLCTLRGDSDCGQGEKPIEGAWTSHGHWNSTFLSRRYRLARLCVPGSGGSWS